MIFAETDNRLAVANQFAPRAVREVGVKELLARDMPPSQPSVSLLGSIRSISDFQTRVVSILKRNLHWQFAPGVAR